MQKVVIIGAGGHGREVAEILRHQAEHSVLGFIDDDPSLQNRSINELPVLGDWSWFEGAGSASVAVICAVGSPRLRRQIVERAELSGLKFASAISRLACVARTAKIGDGVMVFPNTFASADSLIDDHAIINVGATISHDTRVSRYATINPGVHLAGNVSIGEGCYVGVGANVIHGVSIGAWSTVGAGAVVIRDLPDNVTAVGVPARIVKSKEMA